MPVYEFECRTCMRAYNKEIDKLVKNLTKKYAENLAKKNKNFKYIELLNPKNEKTKIPTLAFVTCHIEIKTKAFNIISAIESK